MRLFFALCETTQSTGRSPSRVMAFIATQAASETAPIGTQVAAQLVLSAALDVNEDVYSRQARPSSCDRACQALPRGAEPARHIGPTHMLMECPLRASLRPSVSFRREHANRPPISTRRHFFSPLRLYIPSYSEEKKKNYLPCSSNSFIVLPPGPRNYTLLP
ncbi:hypothetical protein C8R46DRAFT_1084349 [Mycena filopes]|nr:hypothetical protein C8R46DRAFT_1084349 [Mycena filopes]